MLAFLRDSFIVQLAHFLKVQAIQYGAMEMNYYNYPFTISSLLLNRFYSFRGNLILML